ncbi:MAG: hypothetical protein AB7F35_08480 [Acetobacteraceae bacterium]
MTGESSRGLRWLITAFAAILLVWPSKAAAKGKNEPPPQPPAVTFRGRHWKPMLIGVLAALALLGWALIAPSPVIGVGWLIGFLFWLGIAVGALVLIAIHAVTGGRWGATCWPVLAPAAASIPIFLLFGLPVAFILPTLFPWASDPSQAGQGVAALYLNPEGWWLRAGIALIAWSLIALVLLRRRNRPHRLLAAIGLVVHAVIITLVGLDWILSLDPHFYSTDFGATLAILQILAALAWTAALRVVPSGGRGRVGDIGGLIIATSLGSLYLGYSQYLVIWYGDLPDRIKWYMDRQDGVWFWVDAFAILLANLVPFFILIRQRWRDDSDTVGLAGGCVLAGLFVHFVWLLAPAFGALAVLSALLALVAIGALWVTLAYGLLAPRLEDAHAG